LSLFPVDPLPKGVRFDPWIRTSRKCWKVDFSKIPFIMGSTIEKFHEDPEGKQAHANPEGKSCVLAATLLGAFTSAFAEKLSADLIHHKTRTTRRLLVDGKTVKEHHEDAPARIVVLGNSNVFSDFIFQHEHKPNQDFLLATLRWVASDGGKDADAPKPADVLVDEVFSLVEAGDWTTLWSRLTEEAQERFLEEIIPEKRKWRGRDADERDDLTGKTHGELLKLGWDELWVTLMRARQRDPGTAIDPRIWEEVAKTAMGKRAMAVYYDVYGDQRILNLPLTGEYRGRILDPWIFGRVEMKKTGREKSAVYTLKSIATAQEQFKVGCYADEDSDGIGEYGLLAELGGAQPVRGKGKKHSDKPFIHAMLGAVDGQGVGARKGYAFILFLPTRPQGGTALHHEGVNADLAEAHYVAFAWPLERGKEKQHEFMITADGKVYCRRAKHFGWDRVHSPRDAFAGRGDQGWGSPVDTEAWTTEEAWLEKESEGKSGPSITRIRVIKMMTEGYDRIIDAYRKGTNADGQALLDGTARHHGFKNWADLCTQCAKAIGAEAYSEILDETIKNFQERMKKAVEERARKEGEGGKEGK
ncbi:MAG: hypothetical protein ACYTHM_25285, partial [Planctomycetota bacterium]